MLKITAGKYKGRSIKTVQGKDVRPTTARVRESLFQILGHRLEGANFLDIFGGSGCMGLEALSRGAQFVCVVEKNSTHLALIREAYTTLKITSPEYKLVLADAFQFAKKPALPPNGQPYDLVFIDPPFRLEGIEGLLESLARSNAISADSLILWEYPIHHIPVEIPGLECVDTREYGDSGVKFYKLASI